MRYYLLSVTGSIIMSAFLLSLSSSSFGQVYRWVDQNGVTNYTDNIQNVPEKYRKSVTETSLPDITTYQEDRQSGLSTPSNRSDSGATGTQSNEDGIGQLRESIETLRSQIKAKKDLIKYVDDRRNLAINPYRNRIITKKELELYDRYVKELPDDEGELVNLESTLRMFEEQ